VILRVNEAHDLGEFDRFALYDHMKSYIAAPPEVLTVNEKNLREFLASTFPSLAHFAAILLRPGTPEKVFTDMRGQMAGEVLKFDSLRSYAVFEAPELRGHDEALSRMMRAFLGLLSVARELYVRLDDLRRHEDPTMAARLDPALDKVADLFEAIAADRGGPSSPAVNAALAAARDVTDQAQAQLEAMVESQPLESLANGLLVLQRTGDRITSLSRVVVGVTGAPAESSGPRVVAAIEQDRGAALAQAARAASALILIGVFWIASAWTAGAMAMTGLAIMMVFFVTGEKASFKSAAPKHPFDPVSHAFGALEFAAYLASPMLSEARGQPRSSSGEGRPS